jgi:DNA-binding NarL/FixJ family response regulator
MNSIGQLEVYIAADYALVREGIINVLQGESGLHVEGGSVSLLCDSTEKRPDVVLCVTEPRPDLAQTIKRLQGSAPESKLACLLLSENDEAIITVLRSGASCIIDNAGGDLLTPANLVEQIKEIACGKFVLSTSAARRLARMYAMPKEAYPSNGITRDAELTEREKEVLALLAEGYKNRDIAVRLSLSEHTVRAHLRGIMQKLNVSNRVQAAALAWSGRMLTQLHGGGTRR